MTIGYCDFIDEIHRAANRFVEFAALLSRDIPPPRTFNPSGGRLYWLWELKDHSAALYKVCASLKKVAERDPASSVSVVLQDNEICAILPRLNVALDQVLNDYDFCVHAYTSNLSLSPLEPLYTHAADVLGVSNVTSDLIFLLGHASEFANGIEWLTDMAMKSILPAIASQAGIPEYVDSTGFTGSSLLVVEETNRTYATGCFTSTAFLCRRLLEMVLLAIMQKRYSSDPAKEHLYFDRNRNRSPMFGQLIQNFFDNFRDFVNASNVTDPVRVDQKQTKLVEIKNRFNVDVHQPGSIPNKSELDDLQSDFTDVLNFLKHIYDNL